MLVVQVGGKIILWIQQVRNPTLTSSAGYSQVIDKLGSFCK